MPNVSVSASVRREDAFEDDGNHAQITCGETQNGNPRSQAERVLCSSHNRESFLLEERQPARLGAVSQQGSQARNFGLHHRAGRLYSGRIY